MLRRARTATGLGLTQALRTPLFVALLVVLPPAFITLAFATTPDVPLAVTVPEGGQTVTRTVRMPTLHGAIMVPMTVAFLSGMVGLFVMLGSREADRRLVLAGYPTLLLLGARLATIAVWSGLVTLLAVGVTARDFVPPQPGPFLLINLVAALHYAFLGSIAGTFLSAMGGTYVMFFAPMIDVGLVQNPMFTREEVAWWVRLLPGYAPTEVLLDASFSDRFDTWAALGGALLYLVALTAVAAALFWWGTGPARGRPAPAGA